MKAIEKSEESARLGEPEVGDAGVKAGALDYPPYWAQFGEARPTR